MPFVKGDPRINREGAPLATPEIKLKRKIEKEIIRDYKEKFFSIVEESGDKIPKKLVEKAEAGDLQAIKETNDRILGKAEQKIKGEIEMDHSGGIDLNVKDTISKFYGKPD
jgi:hypothetical protein